MDKMKRIIFPLIFVFAPVLVSASHTQEHLISELQESIRILQEKVAALSGKPVTAAPVRAVFHRDLYHGLRKDQEVRSLQEFLAGQGFYKEEITGNFFSITKEALRGFQRARGLPSTGYFGPLTRAAVEKLQSDDDGEREQDEDIGAEGAENDESADSALDSQDSVSGVSVSPSSVSAKPAPPLTPPPPAASLHYFAPVAPVVAEVDDGEPGGESDDEAEDAGEDVDSGD